MLIAEYPKIRAYFSTPVALPKHAGTFKLTKQIESRTSQKKIKKNLAKRTFNRFKEIRG